MGSRRRRRARARSVVESKACRLRSAQLPPGGQDRATGSELVLLLLVLALLVLALCCLTAAAVTGIRHL